MLETAAENSLAIFHHHPGDNHQRPGQGVWQERKADPCGSLMRLLLVMFRPLKRSEARVGALSGQIFRRFCDAFK
ncbi:hypothetical protein KCP71_08635 [Salmonella enterica subsp. enterica]|nr:hypothetical protein KCP71_08635 [Salmonella enterica subsp. enterica]